MAQVHAMPNGHLNKHEGGRKGKPVGIWGTRPLQRFIPHGGRKTNNNDTTKTANMYALLILRIVFARAAEMGAGAGSCPMVSVASCGCGATGTCGGGASGGARDATGAATGEVVTGTCVADATASSGTDAVPAGRPSTTRGLAVRAAFGLRTPEAERAVPERGRGTEGRRGAPPPSRARPRRGRTPPRGPEAGVGEPGVRLRDTLRHEGGDVGEGRRGEERELFWASSGFGSAQERLQQVPETNWVDVGASQRESWDKTVSTLRDFGAPVRWPTDAVRWRAQHTSGTCACGRVPQQVRAHPVHESALRSPFRRK